MSTSIYGALEPVGALKANDLAPGFRSPDGRFVALRRGRHLVVVDTAPEAPEEVAHFSGLFTGERTHCIHPDGQRLATLDLKTRALSLRGPEGLLVQAPTDTSRVTWNGQLAGPDTPRPTWGWGQDHLMFSADGERLVLATHDAEGRAVALLLSARDLAVVDVLRDLRCYSHYVTYHAPGKPEYVPLGHWGESELSPDPRDPEAILGIVNSGDCCAGVFWLRVEGDRLVNGAPGAFSKTVLAVDSYGLGGLYRLPGEGLLVFDRDDGLTRVSWPPTGALSREEKLARVWASEHLRQGGYEITLPFPAPGGDLQLSGELSVTERHVLLNVDTGGYQTAAIAAFDARSLAPLGLVPRPKSRLRFDTLGHLGRDLFAGAGTQTTGFWRLRV